MSNFKDLGVATVLTAPSPATTGTTIVLTSGHGARLPAIFPFPVTAAPPNQIPSVANSEFLLVTNRVSDTLTVVRAQAHGLTTSTAQSIAAGWIISNAIYSDDLFTSSINNATVLTGTPNGVLTTFTIATPPTMAWVFKNGVFMQPGAGNDYTLSGNTFTFATAPATGAKLIAIPIVGNQVMISGSSAPVMNQRPIGLVNGSNTTYTVPGGSYVGGTLEFISNGLVSKRDVHYTETSPGTGTFTVSDAPLTGDDLIVNFLVVNSVFGNAATVGGYLAAPTPTANTIPVLDSNARLPLLANNPVAIFRSTAGQVIPNASPTTLAFSNAQEVSDPLGWHDGTTSPTRVVPGVAGTYMVTGSSQWNDNTGGAYRGLFILVNGATIFSNHTTKDSAGRAYHNISWPVTIANATDYIELSCIHDAGGSLTLTSYMMTVERKV